MELLNKVSDYLELVDQIEDTPLQPLDTRNLKRFRKDLKEDPETNSNNLSFKARQIDDEIVSHIKSLQRRIHSTAQIRGETIEDSTLRFLEELIMAGNRVRKATSSTIIECAKEVSDE